MNSYFVYILSNKHRTALYIGVTNNLELRVWQHREGIGGSHTSRYNCCDLLYYEIFQDINYAIAREKEIKHWNRAWKLDLVKKQNPELKDLAHDWYKDTPRNARTSFGTHRYPRIKSGMTAVEAEQMAASMTAREARTIAVSLCNAGDPRSSPG